MASWASRAGLSSMSFLFGISHSPRTPLGHSHRWSICKHYVDKLQRFSPKCHNIFILTMPTALGRRYGAVYGEKSPKTRLVRIYCYGNTLYIVIWALDNRCLRGSLFKAIASDTIFPRFEPPRGLLCLFFFLNSLFFLIYFFFICVFIFFN